MPAASILMFASTLFGVGALGGPLMAGIRFSGKPTRLRGWRWCMA